MSRVFLLSTNTTVDPYPVYPLGMGIVAGALQSAGHEVCQFDLLVAGESEAALFEAVDRFKPEFICLSMRNIDAVDSFNPDLWYLGGVKHLISELRQRTGATLVVGGSAFSVMPEKILDYVQADYGISGEGERSVPDLIGRLERGEAIPSLIHGSAPPLAPEEMGSPLLEQEFVDFYTKASGMVNLQTKRGCPYGCVYCTYPALEGDAFRFRDPKAVVADLQRLKKDHQVDRIFFTDSIFNDPTGHYLEVAEEMIRAELGMSWCAFFRPAGTDRSNLALLKRAGLYAMELGTDAASDATLEGLDKGFTFAEALEMHDAAVAEEIPAAHFIMFGGPEETPESLEEGLDNIRQINKGVVFGFSGIRILPGTPLHQRAIDDGILPADDSLLEPTYYFSPGIDRDWMNQRIEESFHGARDRIFPPCKGQEKMKVMHNFGFKGILWDQLIRFPRKRGRA